LSSCGASALSERSFVPMSARSHCPARRTSTVAIGTCTHQGGLIRQARCHPSTLHAHAAACGEQSDWPRSGGAFFFSASSATLAEKLLWTVCLRLSFRSPDAHPREAPQTTRLPKSRERGSVLELLWVFAFVILVAVIVWGFRHRK
jgi:hypothetical protein